MAFESGQMMTGWGVLMALGMLLLLQLLERVGEDSQQPTAVPIVAEKTLQRGARNNE
ncbi:MAG TPA: hypothetical protein VM182_00455 [Terriglobia bacterium]|nr:hypothetical protein [Terriglobia bacterium]